MLVLLANDYSSDANFEVVATDAATIIITLSSKGLVESILGPSILCTAAIMDGLGNLLC